MKAVINGEDVENEHYDRKPNKESNLSVSGHKSLLHLSCLNIEANKCEQDEGIENGEDHVNQNMAKVMLANSTKKN